ncbi:DUF3793 family protein [Caloramator sp. ALD01]|uniref:DUF3793 family protein n=1 Tax=Caloramator sp. ALD01 TaxID=1031288 RepID=UPI000429910B|nr:DUF3793 family protein [Caloramator sp. ALD01]
MIINNIFKNLKKLDKKLYVKSLILYHCAPTIFCNKPSTIITIEDFDMSFFKSWRDLKDEIYRDYKIEFFEIKLQNKKLTAIIYKQDKLETIIKRNIDFLLNFGYREYMTTKDMLKHLKSRYNYSCPHELGVFLGIPIDDVRDFICNKGECKLCGYWKVYNDVEYAKQTFRLYDEAKTRAIDIIKSKFLDNNVA